MLFRSIIFMANWWCCVVFLSARTLLQKTFKMHVKQKIYKRGGLITGVGKDLIIYWTLYVPTNHVCSTDVLK